MHEPLDPGDEAAQMLLRAPGAINISWIGNGFLSGEEAGIQKRGGFNNGHHKPRLWRQLEKPSRDVATRQGRQKLTLQAEPCSL
jgi:hypothetical protein